MGAGGFAGRGGGRGGMMGRGGGFAGRGGGRGGMGGGMMIPAPDSGMVQMAPSDVMEGGGPPPANAEISETSKFCNHNKPIYNHSLPKKGKKQKTERNINTRDIIT